MQKVLFIDVVHLVLKERLESRGYTCVDATTDKKEDVLLAMKEASGIVIRARETNASGLTHIHVLLSDLSKSNYNGSTYGANVTLDTTMTDHFLAWSSFQCVADPGFPPQCPELTTQLAEITGVTVGTGNAQKVLYQPTGVLGDFMIEFESMRALTSRSTVLV